MEDKKETRIFPVGVSWDLKCNERESILTKSNDIGIKRGLTGFCEWDLGVVLGFHCGTSPEVSLCLFLYYLESAKEGGTEINSLATLHAEWLLLFLLLNGHISFCQKVMILLDNQSFLMSALTTLPPAHQILIFPWLLWDLFPILQECCDLGANLLSDPCVYVIPPPDYNVLANEVAIFSC